MSLLYSRLMARLLVVSAHSADFVWRAAGAIATATANGGTATIVSLSFGERGESGELWKQEGQTLENVKAIRRKDAGAKFRILEHRLDKSTVTALRSRRD